MLSVTTRNRTIQRFLQLAFHYQIKNLQITRIKETMYYYCLRFFCSEKPNEEITEPAPAGLELDEEGYVIRKDSDSVNSGRNEDSDSDSDTDSGLFL